MAKKDEIVYTDYIKPVVFRDKAININTKKGKRAATRMAHRIAEGKERIENVPASYRNYVNGVLYGSMPTSKAIDKAGRKFAPVVVGAAAAPWLISGGVAAATNPLIKTIFDIAGSVDGIRNAVSKNGVRKTIRLAKEGNVIGAIKSGVGDVFDIAGGIGLVGDTYRYGKGAAKRLAESVVRIGDSADKLYSIKKQLLDKYTINYILNPFADPNLAYKLPYGYSGEAFEGLRKAHYGDVIDQYFRKVSVPNTLPKKDIPVGMKDYIETYYPKKDVAYVDLGELDKRPVDFSVTLRDGEIFKDGLASAYLRTVDGRALDPGGYNYIATRKGNDLLETGYDIWKFNADDYVKRYPEHLNAGFNPHNKKIKNIIEGLKLSKKIPYYGLKFIDRMGSPIVYKFTKTTPGYYHSGIDDTLLKTDDNFLEYTPSQESMEMIQKAYESLKNLQPIQVSPSTFNK